MKFFFRLCLVLLCFALVLGGYGFYSYTHSSHLQADKTVFFERGSGFMDITQQLADEGVIAEPWTMRLAAVLIKQHSRLKAGEYVFAAGATPEAVLAKLVKGEQVLHTITFPEGLTVAEIATLLRAEPLLAGDVPTPIEEGSLLPETYAFLRGDSRESIVRAMQKAMRETLEKAWQQRAPNLPLASAQEALILASIVEKETGRADERARVAGVFINRLRLGMKLQSDPTTAYAVTLTDGPMNRALTTADLKRDLPHNTYVIPALPPTPIACPGKAAIVATLAPMATDELFFVASGDGGHNFATTLKQHEANVAQYRLQQKP